VAEQPQQLVQKLRNYCNILRDDLSALAAQAGAQASGDDPSASSGQPACEDTQTGL
jgi:hypothetical protein